MEVRDVSVRTQRDGHWCWVSTHALQHIRDHLQEAQSAILVYVALCELASEESKRMRRDIPTILATHGSIGAKAGNMSRRTVIRRLAELKSIGLVSFDTPKFKTASTYTLLQCRPETKAEFNGEM